MTADNFPQWVFSGAKVAKLRHRQSGLDPARHPVFDVGYPGSPFRARMSPIALPTDWKQEILGPVGLKPELSQGRSELIYIRF